MLALYIAQVKQKYRIIERDCYNLPKSDDSRQPKCPEHKEKAIVDALTYYKMIYLNDPPKMVHRSTICW